MSSVRAGPEPPSGRKSPLAGGDAGAEKKRVRKEQSQEVKDLVAKVKEQFPTGVLTDTEKEVQ